MMVESSASSNTAALGRLIDKRNEILEKLEVAETRYIRSFKANIQPTDVQGKTALESSGEDSTPSDQLRNNRDEVAVSFPRRVKTGQK